MTNSVIELNEKSAKELIKASIKIDAYASPVIEYNGVAKCVFCKEPLKSHNIEGKWITSCDCEKSKDFATTRDELLREYVLAKAKLDMLDTEVKENSIRVFKEIYVEEEELKKVIFDKNNSLIMKIETLRDE